MARSKSKDFGKVVRRYISVSTWTLLLVVIGLVYWRYSIENTKYNEELMMTTANLAMDMIDGDVHSKIGITEDEYSSSYQLIQKQLKVIEESSEKFFYAYTWRLNEDNEIIFIVDTDPIEESYLGSIYEEEMKLVKENYNTMTGPVIEEGYIIDDWGTLRTVCAPILTSNGHVDGVICIDINKEDFVTSEQDFLIILGVILGGSIILSWLVSALVSRRLMEPFKKFVKEVNKSVKSKFEYQVEESTVSLLRDLSISFNKAIEKARANTEDIAKQVEERTATLQALNEKMVDREVRMRDLKKEISELKKKKNV